MMAVMQLSVSVCRNFAELLAQKKCHSRPRPQSNRHTLSNGVKGPALAHFLNSCLVRIELLAELLKLCGDNKHQQVHEIEEA